MKLVQFKMPTHTAGCQAAVRPALPYMVCEWLCLRMCGSKAKSNSHPSILSLYAGRCANWLSGQHQEVREDRT